MQSTKNESISNMRSGQDFRVLWLTHLTSLTTTSPCELELWNECFTDTWTPWMRIHGHRPVWTRCKTPKYMLRYRALPLVYWLQFLCFNLWRHVQGPVNNYTHIWFILTFDKVTHFIHFDILICMEGIFFICLCCQEMPFVHFCCKQWVNTACSCSWQILNNTQIIYDNNFKQAQCWAAADRSWHKRKGDNSVPGALFSHISYNAQNGFLLFP